MSDDERRLALADEAARGSGPQGAEENRSADAAAAPGARSSEIPEAGEGPAHDLEKVKQLVREGKFEIGNEAAKAGGNAVHVSTYARADKRQNEQGGIVFQWSRAGIGFGEITLWADGGRLVADTEAMSTQFVLDVIKQALEEARFV